MNLSKDFWDTQSKYVLVGADGSLRFTAAGRAYYTRSFADQGVNINTVRTIDRFCEILRPITAARYDETTRQMEELMNAPGTSEAERQIIADVLKIPYTPRAAVAPKRTLRSV